MKEHRLLSYKVQKQTKLNYTVMEGRHRWKNCKLKEMIILKVSRVER